MRYRNRIKIAPGINLNLSKSGISTTVGPKGANLNFGKGGTHLNTGIPGTGIYNRTKLSHGKEVIDQLNVTGGQVGVKISLDSKYQPIIEIFDENGRNVATQTNINKIKRKPEYKEGIKEIYKVESNKINKITQEFTDLYKETIKPELKDSLIRKIENLSPKFYSVTKFPIEIPTSEYVEKELMDEAKVHFNSILFWKNGPNRKKYIMDHLDSRYNVKVENWKIEKDLYHSKELERKKETNKLYQQEYQNQLKLMESNLEGKKDFVLESFESILNNLEIKPEFFLDFEYNEDDKAFNLDLDLPEIEHLPVKKSSILASGKLSVKDKTQKELKEDYALTVTGLGFLISGIVFQSSVGINQVNISAYTQRIDRKTGNEIDDYIYTVSFERDVFSKLNFKKLNPILAIEGFDYQMNMNKSFDFKSLVLKKE